MNKTGFLPQRLLERTERLCAVMAEVSGVDATQDTRKRPVAMARVMVANALLQDGYTENAVGAVLGRNHSTINHYRNRMTEILTAPGYDAEREIWNKFKGMI